MMVVIIDQEDLGILQVEVVEQLLLEVQELSLMRVMEVQVHQIQF
tara:strand:+ start:276 stop:410 length:135 start_codon:yes stop_codon:yes gene_type:complete